MRIIEDDDKQIASVLLVATTALEKFTLPNSSPRTNRICVQELHLKRDFNSMTARLQQYDSAGC